MKPLKWYFDYEPKGEFPRKDRRLLNHESRQRARREISGELEAVTRERYAFGSDPERLQILCDLEATQEEIKGIERRAAFEGKTPLQIVAEDIAQEEENRRYQEAFDLWDDADPFDWYMFKD